MIMRISSTWALGIALAVAAQDVDYSQFVNPFIGSEGGIPGYACKSCPVAFARTTRLTWTDGGGDIFVGGAVPFGMVKLGIDTFELPVNQSALNGGWTPKGKVTGMSLMHESGTGGGPKYVPTSSSQKSALTIFQVWVSGPDAAYDD